MVESVDNMLQAKPRRITVKQRVDRLHLAQGFMYNLREDSCSLLVWRQRISLPPSKRSNPQPLVSLHTMVKLSPSTSTDQELNMVNLLSMLLPINLGNLEWDRSSSFTRLIYSRHPPNLGTSSNLRQRFAYRPTRASRLRQLPMPIPATSGQRSTRSRQHHRFWARLNSLWRSSLLHTGL